MEKTILIDINDIKSPYIIKHIFSYLDIISKLKMVIYNKKFQNIFCFDIKDYKKLSGIEKVGEKNGKGKEYNLYRNNLLFEGEYIIGKRNGKGYEYNILGKIEFEGEYLNGKKWNGNIIEYDWESGEIIFDGFYIEGEKIENC